MNNSFTNNLDYETTSDDNTSEENKDLVKITKPEVFLTKPVGFLTKPEIILAKPKSNIPKKPTNISSIKVSNPTLLLLKANKK